MKRGIKDALLLPLALAALWLLLGQSLSWAQGLWALLLGVLLAALAAPFRPVRARLRRPGLLLRLSWQVMWDICASNYAVAKLIVLPERRPRQPVFLDIPLTLQDPHGLAVLACIITYTPGTVWAGYDGQRQVLTLHILDLSDEGQWLRTIQQRYQQSLLEIFEA